MASQLRPVTVALCALAVSLSVPSPAMARQTGCQLSTTTAGLTACFAVLALTTTTLTSNQTNGIGDTNSGAAGAAGNDAGFFEGILFGATNGGAGGVAPSVELLVQFQSFSITTNGILSSPRTAITVRSLGGDGGRGGDDFGIFSGLGGDGGRGGNGSTVSLTTTSTGGVIQTGPSFTFLFLPFFGGHGIYALSRGGDGGDGGDGDSAISGSGGDGGLGGNGGTVTLDINNAITTSALLGRAIFATSRGGNGGDGGSGSGIVSGGGAGSGSGNGGSVSVGNTGTLRTFGSFAAGIFAQSIGGYSGDGGDSDGGVAFGGGATSGGDAGSVAIGNSGNITTSGTRSHAIFAQSVGGSGGDDGGGNGVV
ncbi:MAG TPA: hypothetical protein VFO19_15975, partial [Vicinamibacterales bacterium]|nr:hypothetical protein [Vicinamibacterales bacterium]